MKDGSTKIYNLISCSSYCFFQRFTRLRELFSDLPEPRVLGACLPKSGRLVGIVSSYHPPTPTWWAELWQKIKRSCTRAFEIQGPESLVLSFSVLLYVLVFFVSLSWFMLFLFMCYYLSYCLWFIVYYLYSHSLSRSVYMVSSENIYEHLRRHEQHIEKAEVYTTTQAKHKKS